jgi:hypothetical protein
MMKVRQVGMVGVWIMNHRLYFGLMLAVLCLLGISQPVHAEDMQRVIETFPGGRIDWTQGLIQANGLASRPDQTNTKAMDRSPALQAAMDDARRKLLEGIKSFRVDSSHRVDQVFGKDDAVMGNLEQLVKTATVIKEEFRANGTVAVTVEMAMDGDFSQLVLPDDIKQIADIKTVSAADKTSEVEKIEKTAPDALSSPADFTGLVVDARGLEVYPTMAPRIYDESGLEVYGSAYASREFAVQRGVVRYGKPIEAVLSSSRVADNPLIVKGLRTTQPGHTDIIISNADASKIRASSAHLSFLKKCRVLVVVSSREEPR